MSLHTHTHNTLTKRLIHYFAKKTQNFRKKNNFKIILFSVFISFLGVSIITFASTTISENINTGGTLTVSGNATLGDDATDLIKSIGSFYASSTLQATGAARFYSTLQADGLTTLGNASTTNLSLTGNLWLNGNATTTSTGNIQGQGILTMLGTGTSTYSGGLQGTALNITSATASSTFANGIILSKGCFLMPDGTCVGAGGGSGTINSGTTGQLSYYAGSGTTLTATSSLFIHSNQNIGIGTTTPNWLLQAAGTRPFLTLSDTGAAANNKHWFLSSQGGNFYVGTSSDAYATTSISALTITNGGNVGIATSSPQSALLSVENVGTGYTFYATDSANDTTPFVIDASGNVGVGTISSVPLLVSGSGDIISAIYSVDGTTEVHFEITSGGGASIDTGYQDVFSIYTSNSSDPRMFFSGTSDQIGISDNNPDAIFEISGSGGSTDLLMVSSDDNNDGNMFVVKNSGKTGISTTTPNWLLQIASTSPFFAITDTDSGTNLKHWLISNQSGNLYFATSTDSYATSTSNLLNLISSNYSVGIGTTSPAEQLSVSGRLFVGGAGTSTIQNNLYVMGTLRSTVSYVGDLIFSNNFRFIETPRDAKVQSLFLQNQYSENIFKINEKGQLVVKEIQTENIEAERGNFKQNIQIGSPQNRTGITIYDKKTGKPYCLEINDGKVINKEGECK